MIIIFAHLLFCVAAMFGYMSAWCGWGGHPLSRRGLNCYCLMMYFHDAYIFMYGYIGCGSIGNYVENSLLLIVHVHEHGNDYMICIIIIAWEIDVNQKLMSCVILISFHRVVYSILIIYAFDSISPCFINIFAESCGLPCLLSCHFK